MSDEKDRFGETLRKKEKADEDRYFAQQDRAKLERLRKESSEVEIPKGLCPRCGIALKEHEHSGVRIDSCPQCNGVWLDTGELETVVERDSEGWFSRWVRTVLQG